MVCVLFENLDPFFDGSFFDGIRFLKGIAEGHLSDELPFCRNAGQLFDFVIDEGIVMLEVDA